MPCLPSLPSLAPSPFFFQAETLGAELPPPHPVVAPAVAVGLPEPSRDLHKHRRAVLDLHDQGIEPGGPEPDAIVLVSPLCRRRSCTAAVELALTSGRPSSSRRRHRLRRPRLCLPADSRVLERRRSRESDSSSPLCRHRSSAVAPSSVLPRRCRPRARASGELLLFLHLSSPPLTLCAASPTNTAVCRRQSWSPASLRCPLGRTATSPSSPLLPLAPDAPAVVQFATNSTNR